MKKNLFKRLISLTLSVCVIFALTACKNQTPANHDNALTPKVILFIGDGMGLNHVYNAELYYEESMYFSSFETQTLVDTHSLSSGYTDSAAAATAMATGQRVQNDYVAKSGGVNLTSITELAKQDEYGTGVVTSDDITGATPAGFSAHANSRDNTSEILLSQKDSSLDLLLGAGDHNAYKTRFEGSGWTWVTSFDQLTTEKKRYVTMFNSVVPENGDNKTPTLTDIACFAIDYMEANYPTGYFLMIEGAKIDKASHSNDIQTMLKNMADFNNAIKAVDQKLAKSGDGYSIIVTADHETGDLQKASSKDKITNGLYRLAKHTEQEVGLYFKTTLDFTPEYLTKDVILNSDIFLLCKYLLAIE
jgi:alkaline phosphatase